MTLVFLCLTYFTQYDSLWVHPCCTTWHYLFLCPCKVMTNLHSIFKSRDVTFPTKVRLVKAMVFPVVMYGCDSWTLNKAKRQRIDGFELWCWRRLLSPLDCKEIQPVILKEISPGCSLEGLMLKLKLQYLVAT